MTYNTLAPVTEYVLHSPVTRYTAPALVTDLVTSAPVFTPQAPNRRSRRATRTAIAELENARKNSTGQ